MTLTVDTFTIPAQRTAPAPITPGEPPKLTPAQLIRAQWDTLNAPRRRYSLAARLLFVGMDLLYGRRRTLRKFRVLEIVARVPYQTWETMSYKQLTKAHRRPAVGRRIWDRIREFRAQQDNEQWHLMILDELVSREDRKQSRLKYDVLPRLIAFGYWYVSCALYVLRPAWSHRLNADFEDHAEHEYAELVNEHPEWDLLPYESDIAADYGTFASLADLFRQIGHDERCHKNDSAAKALAPRLR